MTGRDREPPLYEQPTDEEIEELARLREATKIEHLVQIARQNLSRDPIRRRARRPRPT